MSRELNKQLFSKMSESQTPAVPMRDIPQAQMISSGDWHSLLNQIGMMKRKITDLSHQQMALSDKIKDEDAQNRARFERHNQKTKVFEDAIKNLAKDLHQKIANISSKISERRLQDGKIQEMMDRHNQVIQNYENRLSQMQKLINEQKMQLANYHATLEEARRDLARIKRL